MSAKCIFIPKQNSVQPATHDFHWSFNAGPIYAQDSSFHYSVFPPTGKESWVFSGSTGTGEEENYFALLLSVPYLDEDLMEYTYKLNDGQGLHVSHIHSIPAPPGFTGFATVDADDAELTIRLDRKTGTVTGNFTATFKSAGYRLKPDGTFKLTRTDQ
ncbi:MULTISPECIES: hypothetical protein [unclassified Pseudomonas]|uniref:hypothetical protein n=1 Tax=unclassified Pseudomonas TaxID=196821 RepID=UPI0030D89C47